jgi:hypothetical protein
MPESRLVVSVFQQLEAEACHRQTIEPYSVTFLQS